MSENQILKITQITRPVRARIAILGIDAVSSHVDVTVIINMIAMFNLQAWVLPIGMVLHPGGMN